jgi:uncharacterized membrane protein YoaK (UPF0700 family)
MNETPTASNVAAASTATLLHDARHGPLPLLLLLLTFVTGLVDAISYLRLGHVFVANMTGNVVFLGFAVADAQQFSIPASLAAIAAFLVGAFAGGSLASRIAEHRARLLAAATLIKIALVGGALMVSLLARSLDPETVRYALIALLAIAMGLQNATARRLGVPDLTTTVLTLTLTGIAADATFAGGKNPNPGRRLAATLSMFLGAATGAVLVLNIGVSAPLALAFALLSIVGIVAVRHMRSAAPWTVGT